MRKQVWIERLGMLCLFLFLISLAITVTINFRWLYHFDIQQLNILDYTDISKEELIKNYGLLLDFLNNPLNTTLALPDFPMSAAGAGHFYDVKKLFLLNYGVLLVTLIPSFMLLRSFWKNDQRWRLLRPLQWGMLLPIFFGFLMAIGFDRFFVTFHEIFFNNDDWLFDPVTDPIINVLPETFFMHCFILFFVLIELFFFVIYWWAKQSQKKTTS
jgi:integral membrane protein (TIGR01906 family)